MVVVVVVLVVMRGPKMGPCNSTGILDRGNYSRGSP